MENEFKVLKRKQDKVVNGLSYITIGELILLIIICGIMKSYIPFIIGTIIIVSINLIIYFYLYRKQNKIFKDQLLNKSFKNINETLKFHSKGQLTKERVYESLVLTKNNGNHYHSNDLLYGTLLNHQFESADLDIYYIIHTGKSSTRVTVFKGRFYIINLNYNTNFHMVIKEEGNIFKMAPKGLKKLELESIDFNKTFNVYSNNDLNVFKTIKPQQIEAIASLEANYEGKLHFAIKNDFLYFGIWDNSNNFELRNYDNILMITQSIEKEIKIIEELIKIIN